MKHGSREDSRAWKGGKTIDADGYHMTFIPDHPRARANGYVLDHILKAEELNGGPLEPGAVVHHRDGKDNNEKIVILRNQSEHATIHAKEKAFKECGNEDFRKCKFCHAYDDVGKMVYSKSGRSHYHRKCHADYELRRRHAIRIPRKYTRIHS